MPERSARQLFESALHAGQNRDYRRAAALLSDLLSRSEEIPEALLFLGRSFHSLGEYGKAIAAFRGYLEGKPEASEAWLFLGRTYLASGHPNQAAFCLERSLKLRPAQGACLGLLGLAYLKKKRPSSAVGCFERAILIEPENRKLYKGYLNALFVSGVSKLRSGDPEMAHQIFGFVVENGLPGIMPILYRASALKDSGRFADALLDYERAMEMSPDDPSLRWQKASCLVALGKTAAALSEIAKLREKDPGIPELSWNQHILERYLAFARLKAGDFRRAADTALGVLKRFGKDSGMHAIAGESFRRLGLVEKAKNHYLRAVKLDEENIDLEYGLISVLWESGDLETLLSRLGFLRQKGGDEDTIEYFETLALAKREADPELLLPRLQNLIRKFGADPELMERLGSALLAMGRPDLAEGWLEKALSLEPEREISLLSLISANEALARPEKLKRSYEKYLDAYPDNGKIRKEFINILFSSEEFAKAAEQLEKALVYDSSGKGLLRLLAIAYRKSGKIKEAAVLYRDFVREKPKEPEFVKSLAFCLDKLGRHELAAKLIAKAIPVIGEDGRAYLLLGIYLAKAGKTEKALDAFRKAAEIDPKEWRTHRNIAAIYEEKGLHEMAGQFAEQARKLKAAAEGKS